MLKLSKNVHSISEKVINYDTSVHTQILNGYSQYANIRPYVHVKSWLKVSFTPNTLQKFDTWGLITPASVPFLSCFYMVILIMENIGNKSSQIILFEWNPITMLFDFEESQKSIRFTVMFILVLYFLWTSFQLE